MAPPDGLPPPAFVTLDRFDTESRAGGELSYMFGDHVASGTRVFRFDVHGQYVDTDRRIGGYLQLAMAHVSSIDPNTGARNSGSGLGDLELGIIAAPRLATPGLDLVIHAGLTLPTGSSGNSGLEANATAGYTRLDDTYQVLGEGVTARVGFSPMVHAAPWFARADVAIDSNFTASDSADHTDLIRLNAGVGAELGSGVSVMLESVNLYIINAPNPDTSGSSWINEAALSARARLGTFEVYGAFIGPLDHDANAVMSAALTMGVERRLR